MQEGGPDFGTTCICVLKQSFYKWYDEKVSECSYSSMKFDINKLQNFDDMK